MFFFWIFWLICLLYVIALVLALPVVVIWFFVSLSRQFAVQRRLRRGRL